MSQPSASERTFHEFGIEFGFKDKFAPRIGGAYDLKGDGRTKIFGNWGVFYDVFKLELPRGSFGGDKWLSYYYALDTPNWPTLVGGANCPPACTGHADPRTYRLPSSLVRIRCNRPGPQADAPAGSVGRRRTPAERSDGRERPLRAQAGRSGGRRHGLPPAGRQRGLCHRQPRRRADGAGVHGSSGGAAESPARLRRGRVRVREAAVEQLVPQRRLHLEPAVRQLLRPLTVG